VSGPPPPPDLNRRRPRLLELPSGTILHRFYQLRFEPIYFDPFRRGRFNAPDGSYGVLYGAKTIDGAFAETFLREPGRTVLSPDFVAARGHVELQNIRPLKLIELGGKGLAPLGATAEILHSGLPYDVPQAWSKALHDHPAAADGIACGARHDDRELCYALFDRARPAVAELSRRVDLDEDWFWEIGESYGVGLAPI